MTRSRTGWSVDNSADLYGLPGWGAPYFSIDEQGHLRVRPDGEGEGARLSDIVASAAQRGQAAPLLIRFDGILGHRLRSLSSAFGAAIEDAGFTGRHRPVYPIKVNQERRVVEGLLRAGDDLGIGLEVGSKPELMAVIALLKKPSLVICNGYKDDTYIDLAVLAVRLGHEVVVVIEKPSEIETLTRVIGREGRDAAPFIGLRSRLAQRGAGRWQGSSGDTAKFGLSATQLVEAVAWLKSEGLVDRVRLLHFHIGSQITAIRPWKAALREGARLFVELSRLGCPLDTFDVGGGLAVDYDGSKTDFPSSMNYTETEYASDVVWAVHDACQKAGLPDPDVVTESGRALVAHHSLMVVEVIGAARLTTDGGAEAPGDDSEPGHEMVVGFRDNLERLSRKTVLEVYHDAVSLREELLQRFGLGMIDLPTRARCEDLFFTTLDRVAQTAATLDQPSEELEAVGRSLAQIYFCNFSVFQSAPDHWAIRQVFPVMPVHRLDERPTVTAVLGDMTCDSDGKIDRFPDRRDVKEVLEVHPLVEGERYLMGIFLIGAYQETLGDLHNLFGDTDTVHIEVDHAGRVAFSAIEPGETAGEVLSYVGYHETWLVGQYDQSLDQLVAGGQLTRDEADEVREDLLRGLAGNTYLSAGEVRSVRQDDQVEAEDEDEDTANEPQAAVDPASQAEPGALSPGGTVPTS